MEDELVKFSTAQLAKKKGFNITNVNSYDENTGKMLPLDPYGHNYALQGVCPAPTQSFLQRWLREKHEIHVQILPYNHKYLISLLKYGQNGSNPNFEEEYNNYEEALEQGLFEALKLIKV